MVAVSCIPFSLIATCGVIYLQGKSLNTLSLLGLIVGIGMLVDNAVVVMENIFRYQSKGYGAKESARLGANEVALAVTAATTTGALTNSGTISGGSGAMTGCGPPLACFG